MQGLHQFNTNPFPRRALRRLLEHHCLGMGSRVLDVGAPADSFRPTLLELGIETDIFSGNTLPASTDCETIDGDAVDLPVDIDGAYDAVVVRDLPAYEGALTSLDALQTTAAFLSCLRPGGSLVLVRTPTNALRLHGDACLRTHLSTFGERLSLLVLRSGFRLARQSQLSVLVSLKTTTAPVTVNTWFERAIDAVVDHDQPCCAASQAAAA